MRPAALPCLFALACGSPAPSAPEAPADDAPADAPATSAPAPTPPPTPQPPPEPPLPELTWTEGTRCGQFGGNWPALLKGKAIAQLTVYEDWGLLRPATRLATSHLKASGTFPDEYDEEDPRWGDWMDFETAKLAWACAYAPGNAADGDPKTAWCEGAEGTGVGEILVVPLGETDSAEVVSGYQKSEAVRTANGRPERVRITLLEAGSVRTEPTQVGENKVWEPVRVLGAVEGTLTDTAGAQPLPLPDAGRTPGREVFVAIEIRSVYPGTKYADTCISDVLPVVVGD